MLRAKQRAISIDSGATLRLFIDRDVDAAVEVREAHRHDMRPSTRIGGSQMSDPLGLREAKFLRRKHGRGVSAGR